MDLEKPNRQFLLPTGEVIPEWATSKHHNQWRAKEYTSEFEKRFRNMGGMVVRLAINVHRDLHANVEPPIKPHPQLMRAMYNYNMRHLEMHNSYERFEGLTELLGNVAAKGGRHSDQASELHSHYLRQQEFIDLGKVEVYHGN